MIVLSLVLVIVAAVTLVLGVFQDGLMLIYVSIGTCLAAMVLLGIGVVLRRREDARAAVAGHDAGAPGRDEASPAPARGDGSPASARAEVPTTSEHDDGDAQVRVREAGAVDGAQAETGEVRPTRKAVVKKAVVKKVAAAPTTPDAADEETTRAFRPTERDEPAGAATPPPARKVAVTKTPTTTPPAETATAKKAAVKKAAAEKATATGEATPVETSPAGSASALPQVRGLGPAKSQALLDRFGSVEALREADLAEIVAVKGIGEGLARELKRELGEG